MGGLRIEGSTSGNVAEVNSANQLKITAETNAAGNPGNVGSMRSFYEVDSGSMTGAALLRAPEVTYSSRLRAGIDTEHFRDEFNATAQNTGAWRHVFSTMTCTMSGGFLVFNSNSTATSGTYCSMQSWRFFCQEDQSNLEVQFVGQITATPLGNECYEAGLFVPNTSSAPADGVYFRLTSAGLIGCVNFNSTETTTGVLVQAANVTAGVNMIYEIVVTDLRTEFYVNEALAGYLATPSGNGYPFMSQALPIGMQYRNTGSVSGSPQMQVKVAKVGVLLTELNSNKPWSHQMAGMGMARQGQNGGTMGQLSMFALSTNPTTALPTATSLTANLPNLLQGGIGLATLWNLAATDMIMHQAINPASTVNITGRTMYITGVHISAVSFTATWTAPAAGGHALLWQIGYGSTGASLATTESSSFSTGTTKITRRVPLGIMTWATGAAVIGTPSDRGDIFVTFQSPIVVNPGEYLTTICRMINGAATASGGLYFTVDYDHYFE